MNEEIKEQTKLEKLRHKNRMEEIAEEFKTKKEIERLKFEYQMNFHRLKRRDIMNTLETKRNFQRQ